MKRDNLIKVYNTFIQKTKKNIKDLADDHRTWSFDVEGKYENFNEDFFDIGNWTTSFFTGMALLSFETTNDTYFLKQLYRFEERYAEKVFDKYYNTMHDLGFLYILYSVGLYNITNDREMKRISLKAADELTKRFNIYGGYIRAWGRMDQEEPQYKGLAIIDSLMNIPLLFWAYKQTGFKYYYDIAQTHANTMLKYLVREDYSVNHAYRFDEETGEPLHADNFCGYDVNSHWARGTAWAIYGFTIAYKYTNQNKFLSTAISLAKRFITLSKETIVPIWDFRLPSNANLVRDSSALAIALCGIIEILKYFKDEELNHYIHKAMDLLCCDEYINTELNCRGVLKYGQVGDPVLKAKEAYTSWGDYFLMEAICKLLYGVEGYW